MNVESFTIITAGIGTLAIFSFLIKENKIYRFFEYLFIGVAAGYIPLVTFKTFLWPQVFAPMFGVDEVLLPDGTSSSPREAATLWYLIPVAFGLLYYCIYSKKLRPIGGLVIAFTIGASAGLSFQGFFAEVVPQVTSSFRPLIVFTAGSFDWIRTFNNMLFLSILLATMYYFFFTFPRKTVGGAFVARYGRLWMMICFGAFFGSTIMARLALLIERLQFLITVWYPQCVALLSGGNSGG